MPIIQGIEIPAPASDAAMETFQTKITNLTTSLTDAANKQLSKEYTLNQTIIQLEGEVNAKNAILNGPPPPVKIPTIKDLMSALDPILDATYPPPPTQKAGGGGKDGETPPKRSPEATKLSQLLNTSLTKVLATVTPKDTGTGKQSPSQKNKKYLQQAEAVYLEETIQSTIRSTIAAIDPDSAKGVDNKTKLKFTTAGLKQLTVDLSDAIFNSGIFPKPGSETFLSNFSDKLYAVLATEVESNTKPDATGKVSVNLQQMQSWIRQAIANVMGDIFEQGTQGLVLNEAAYEERATNMYDYLSNLLSYTKEFEKQVDKAKASAILAAQDITTSNVNVRRLVDQSVVALDGAVADAAQQQEGGNTIQTLQKFQQNIDKYAKLLKQGDATQGGKNNDKDKAMPIDNAELAAVQNAAEAGAIAAANGTLSADQNSTVTTAMAVLKNAQSDFAASVTALTNSMSAYTKELDTYFSNMHQYKLSEALHASDVQASSAITNIVSTSTDKYQSTGA